MTSNRHVRTTATSMNTPAGIGAALGANLLWGLGNVIIAKVPLGGLGIAFHRLWMGALLYTVVLYLRGGRLRWDSFRYGSLGAVAFAADICFFFLAVKHTTLADATTISALQPVVILLFAGALFGERITRRHVACTVVAVIGIAVVVRGSVATGNVTVFGEVMATLALFAWAGYFIASKRAREHLDTLEYMTVVMIVGCLVVAPFAFATGQATGGGYDGITREALAWVALVVLVPGSGHLLVNWAHQHTTITLSSLLTLLMPVLSTAGAAIWLGQDVNRIQVVGIGVVLGSLAIVIIGDARARSPEHSSVETPLGLVPPADPEP